MHTPTFLFAGTRAFALTLTVATLGGVTAGDACAAQAAGGQTAGGRERDGSSISESVAINGAWKSWREALDARAAFHDPREHAEKLEQYKAWLKGLDAGVPVPGAPNGGSAAWMSALRAEGRAQREVALRRVLSRIEPQAPVLDDPAVQAEKESAQRVVAAWQQRVTLLAEDLVKIEGALGRAQTLEEGGPESIRSLTEKWVKEGMTRQPGVRVAAAPVLDRVDALEQIEQQVSAAELLRVAREAGSERPELLFGAWRRLSNRGQAVWPSGEEELAAEVSLRPKLVAAAKLIKDSDRSTYLQGEVEAEQSRRLTRLLSAATDDATLAAADSAIRDLGLSEKPLDGRIRYNLMLNRLKRTVSAAGVTDAQARTAAQEFVNGARELQGGIAFLSGASGVVASLDAVSQGLSISPATLEPGRFGPSAAGLGAGTEDGATLSFEIRARSGASAARLEFILVGEGAAASYVTTHEVTVGQVAAIVATRGAERELPRVMPVFRPLEDSRLGPRSWEWSHDQFDVPQIVPSRSWLSPTAVMGGVDYPKGMEIAAPSEESPMQQISAGAATYVASLAGCRLPTTGEWSSLLREHAPESRKELANLRDTRWKAFDEHMKVRRANGRWSEEADSGMFRAAGEAMKEAKAPYSWDDGWLWFSPESGRENQVVTHVLGNVAEFVTTEPWKLPDGAAEAGKMAAAGLDGLRVVGGSALSDPGQECGIPQELDRIDAIGGFADVGFRLAFGAAAAARPTDQAGRHVVELLTPTPYIKPR